MSSAASQTGWMLRMEASWRVRSLATVVGSLAYSSRACATQRSMLAALLIRKSPAIHASPLLNVGQQAGPGVPCPRAFIAGQHLVLHHRAGGAQLQQVHREPDPLGQFRRQLPWEPAGPRRPLTVAAKEVGSQPIGEAGGELSRGLSAVAPRCRFSASSARSFKVR